ncbi:DNA-directed DNA polymerase theta [Cordyceps fumosorosea ARSEF 2679]|uniref:DNA-directed DNA polymerase theta n=1 Tax=Cordyceps fumosorosea (strain ARSEF 2679) TaxID=1081104 RepID=A0A168DXX2_CORFA|nr:DNA-directed DNA polymerase theta [Cordyceps fumosorosea ARSEF 2679]OAA73140.1 DNA-directed DNA polymerase theta [Cordyceps fumosorosea ARSEF 2679]
MQHMNGLLHTTSLQLAQNAHTDPVAGQKRTWSAASNNVTGSVDPDSTPKPPPFLFKRSVALPNAAPKLTPSRITALGPSSSGDGEYTQRHKIAATPSSSLDPELHLSHAVYDLPPRLVANFAALGINYIYPWQRNCLKGPGLLSGERNLVYCAPTGGGKSLVADLLMLKRILHQRESKALLVLPYVALVQEKVRWLRKLVEGLKQPSAVEADIHAPFNARPSPDGLRVLGFFGGGKVRATWDDFEIGVCTLEKANMLINAAIQDCSISKLRAVVLDELHMIDDEHRGYTLELIGTKLLSLEHTVQIVGMSATIPNMDLMAQWLNGHSFETRYRPVPIEEHLVCNGAVFAADDPRCLPDNADQLKSGRVDAVRAIGASSHKELSDPVLNAVVTLAHETASAGYGVLMLVLSPALRSAMLIQKAGITAEERDLIAAAYDAGTLLVCVATCSLAAGINLPARRVILHNARMGRDFVGPAMLRQMRGRAGRQGKSPVGETYLCCREADLEPVVQLIKAELPKVTSCLTSENRRVQRAVLEVIAVHLATSYDSIRFYFAKSLLALTQDMARVDDDLRASLRDLEGLELIEADAFGNYAPTRLGGAIVASAIDPDDGIFVHRELVKALRAFVMDGELHILYVFTPVQDLGVTINWQVFRNELQLLDESGLRVLRFLGIKPTAILQFAQGVSVPENTPEAKELSRVYKRFYLALQLRDLCNEVPIHVVARKYDSPRGAVQTLSQTCHGFAAGVIKFCQHMDWGLMAAALDHFSDRLLAGARTELLSLAKIPFIKSRTARVFWENGFRTVGTIANADPKELVPILKQANPSKSRVKGLDIAKYEEKLLSKANIISASANRLWSIQMQAEMDLE